MLAKKTSKNQLTLPKALLAELPPTDYFDVRIEGGCLVLTPVDVGGGDAVRDKLAALGIRDEDIAAARNWARGR